MGEHGVDLARVRGQVGVAGGRVLAVDLVQQFLETLSESSRAAFTACVLEEMSVVEAAEALGVNVNTLYSRVRTVRARFMSTLAARGVHR